MSTIALVASTLIGLFGAEPKTPKTEDQKLLEQFGKDPRVYVNIAVGSEYHAKGMTRLSIPDTGRIRVTRRSVGDKNTYDLATPWKEKQIKALGKELVALGYCQLTAQTGARPSDDLVINIELKHGKEIVCQAQLWWSDRTKDANLNALLTRYDAIVAEVIANKKIAE